MIDFLCILFAVLFVSGIVNVFTEDSTCVKSESIKTNNNINYISTIASVIITVVILTIACIYSFA